MKFEELSKNKQAQARAAFLGAGPGDGYEYSVRPDGRLLCRRPLDRLSLWPPDLWQKVATEKIMEK